MTQEKHIVYGVHVADRLEHIGEVQKVLSEYGCNIKTRLGLHEVSETCCSSNGVLILEMFGNESRCTEMFDKLNAVTGVEVQQMVFDHSG